MVSNIKSMEPATLLARAASPLHALSALEGTAGMSHAALLSITPPALYAHLAQQLGNGAIDQSLLTFMAGPLPAGVQAINTADLNATQQALETGGLRWLLSTPLQEPYLTLPDLGALGALCERYGCTLLLDNTLTPLLQKPALYGAQASVYSNLALLGGLPSPNVAIVATHTLQGVLASLPPSVAPINLNLATLPLRMRTHSGNAQAIADVLAGYPGVRAVYHPGLSTHPQFEYAETHFEQGCGGMVYADILAPTFAPRLHNWLQGRQAWGGSRSAVWSMPQRPTLYGLWAGLEDIGDLLTELEGALT